MSSSSDFAKACELWHRKLTLVCYLGSKSIFAIASIAGIVTGMMKLVALQFMERVQTFILLLLPPSWLHTPEVFDAV